MKELEKLQKRQKEIEEENKVKKKIISDTITERFARICFTYINHSLF